MTTNLPRAGRRLRLIVVDDNADAGRSLGMLLKISGYEVLVFQSGQEALDGLERFGPDAMILDLAMPKMTGLELARRVRSHSAWHDLTLIVVSANSRDDTRGATMAAGIDFHFEKPFHCGPLLKILAKLESEELAVAKSAQSPGPGQFQ